ncbi:MAG: hemin-degrading factor [Salibacteraceae bacterium]
MDTQTDTLKERWNKLKEEQPKLRIRNAAEELGVSEAELLATRIGDGVTLLRPEFKSILGKLEALGYVMALTRNDDVVHERKGIYLNPSLNNSHVGLFVGEDIDLRIFWQPWAFAFAVEEIARKQLRKSLQFFAKNGMAVHKIYLTEKSNQEAFDQLVAEFQEPSQVANFFIQALPQPDPEKPDSEIDQAGFQESWCNLKDTHHFFGMLKKYRLTRTQALRLAPEGNYAVPVQPVAMRKVLQLAAERQVPIMAFVGNPGMIQIHTGPVKKLLEYGDWYNVMDPAFNLHVNEPSIQQCWVVRKPTEDGVVTALECFNQRGEQVLQFFGQRKPGIPEKPEWTSLMADVEIELKQ